jgi:hypothetical protein
MFYSLNWLYSVLFNILMSAIFCYSLLIIYFIVAKKQRVALSDLKSRTASSGSVVGTRASVADHVSSIERLLRRRRQPVYVAAAVADGKLVCLMIVLFELFVMFYCPYFAVYLIY